MNSKFYEVCHGWANKYFWFDVVEPINKSSPKFENMIKENNLTFSKQSGTTSADIHGSTLALFLFSQKFVNLLKKAKITNIKIYKIKFVPKMRNIGIYYYIEFNKLPTIWKGKGANAEVTFKLKDCGGQNIFTMKKTKMVIVSEKLKKLIEKERLTNFEFEQITPSN